MPRKWAKSSYGGGNSGACVEVAVAEPTVPVRDSRTATDNGPVIEFGRPAFAGFLAAVRVGRDG
ncbi:MULTISPECIES: DUF397 domain-containing protein [unclassified Streptomyces]|uniref:DUF397 domain-containing protein n=1 Tax=unclassified Streptomyces TaxID=2593676 RepID=UPI001011B34C|nr:DUF397 domain-containing protein [Streptomyces sp. GZWMJZ-114]